MIDYNALIRAIEQEIYAYAYGGGYGAALMDLARLKNLPPEKLLNMARHYGIDPDRFITYIKPEPEDDEEDKEDW